MSAMKPDLEEVKWVDSVLDGSYGGDRLAACRLNRDLERAMS